MKPSSIITLALFLISNVLAGGIRGAYERLFIWYAYQAEIEWLSRNPGYDVDTDRQILSNIRGSVEPHGTLTLNEFINYSNNGDVNTGGADVRDLTNLDRAADYMLRKELVASRWQPNILHNVWPNSWYPDVLTKVGRWVHLMNTTGEIKLTKENPNIRNAGLLIEKVRDLRVIDYEKHRFPLMKAAPELSGVKWEGRYYQLREMQAFKFDLQLTLDANENQQNLAQRIDAFVDKYHNDPNEGKRRRGHFNAYNSAEKSLNLIVKGKCQ